MIQKEKINFSKLLDYIKKFNSNVVAKRMGYILEALRIGDANFINELKRYINNKYYILDPILTKNDSFKNDWKLIANISKEEISKAIQT